MYCPPSTSAMAGPSSPHGLSRPPQVPSSGTRTPFEFGINPAIGHDMREHTSAGHRTGPYRPRLRLTPSPASLNPAEVNQPSVAFPAASCSTQPEPVLRLRGGGKGRHNAHQQSRKQHHQTYIRPKTRSSRTSPLTDLDKLKEEENAVKLEISRLNLALRDVEGDGNCLFRALSDQLYGDQKRHPEIRKLTCDYMEAHEDELGSWASFCSFNDGEDYAAYVKRMRKSGQYASEVEVHAAARMLSRDIRIVHSNHSETIPCNVQPSSAPSPRSTSPPAHAHDPITPRRPQNDEIPDETTPSQPRRRTRSATSSLLSTPAAPPPSSPLYATALALYLPTIRQGRSMLWLALFNDAEHYQSVRRKGDRERGPAEVEDRLAEPHEKDMSEAAKRARGELAAKAGAEGSVETGRSGRLQVISSLPAHHGFSDNYIDGILSRVKGDVGEAVEILISEFDIAEESSSDGHQRTASDDDAESYSKVSDMLVETSPPSAPHILTTEYREPDRPKSSSPTEPTSPSGSSSTANTSRSAQSDISRSSKVTTPSHGSKVSFTSASASRPGSSRSNKSLKLVDGESVKSRQATGAMRGKPYDKPLNQKASAVKRAKQLSTELEELQVGGLGHPRAHARGRQLVT